MYKREDLPKLWKILTKNARQCINEERENGFERYLKKQFSLIECGICKMDAYEYLKNHSIEKYKNIIIDNVRVGMFIYIHDFHNYVNQKLGKPKFPLSESYKLYPVLSHNEEQKDPSIVINKYDNPINNQTKEVVHSVQTTSTTQSKNILPSGNIKLDQNFYETYRPKIRN